MHRGYGREHVHARPPKRAERSVSCATRASLLPRRSATPARPSGMRQLCFSRLANRTTPRTRAGRNCRRRLPLRPARRPAARAVARPCRLHSCGASRAFQSASRWRKRWPERQERARRLMRCVNMVGDALQALSPIRKCDLSLAGVGNLRWSFQLVS
jgi:hypothetical protein